MDIKVYEAISKVQGALAKEGISKDQKNAQQGFKYRGIDDVYNTLAPFLAENKLTILPRMMGKEVTEKASKSGGVLTYTTITAEFDLVSAEDGSKHTVSAYGEAMDSGDKSIGKAMSYAYKAMAFMTFAIPTDGDNDPDAQTHEVVQTPASAPTTQPSAPQAGWQGYTFAFGKHKGKTMRQVDEESPDYLTWLSAQDNSKYPTLVQALAEWGDALPSGL